MNEIVKKPDTKVVRVAKPDPMTVLNNAINSGMSPEAIAKLVELQERMEYTKASKAFDSAMARFKAECPPIKRSLQGQFGTYAPLDEIDLTIQPHLKKNGLSYKWDCAIESEGDVLMQKVTCIVKHKGGGLDTSTFSAPIDNRMDKDKGANQMQRYAAALTYGRRQSLIQALGLTTTDQDIDADGLDDQYITDEQLTKLTFRVEEQDVDVERFCKHFKVKDLTQLRLRDFDKAIKLLNERAKRISHDHS